MVVATADAARPAERAGRCCSRGTTSAGFVFFTNYGRARAPSWPPTRTPAWSSRGSRCSGRWWSPGAVERVDRAETEAYFATRPRGSQLGAWASPQSQVVPDRAALEAALAGRRPSGSPTRPAIPAPPHWGGFRVAPGDGRVLAGPGQPAARPAALPSHRRRAAGSSSGWPRDGVCRRPEPRGARRWAIDVRPLRRAGVPAAVARQRACRSFGFQFTAVAVPVQMYAITRSLALGRPARLRRPGAADGLRAVGRRGRRRASTAAGCCSASSALIWAGHARPAGPGAAAAWTARCCCWR